MALKIEVTWAFNKNHLEKLQEFPGPLAGVLGLYGFIGSLGGAFDRNDLDILIIVFQIMQLCANHLEAFYRSFLVIFMTLWGVMVDDKPHIMDKKTEALLGGGWEWFV